MSENHIFLALPRKMLAAPLTEGAEWMASNKPKALKTKPGKNTGISSPKARCDLSLALSRNQRRSCLRGSTATGIPCTSWSAAPTTAEIYLETFRLGGTSYRFAGILARGSTRSQCVAREYGVPLYRCLADLTPGIDLACAAMGASGSDVVLGLLARGIHVLCEHPLKSSRLQSALEDRRLPRPLFPRQWSFRRHGGSCCVHQSLPPGERGCASVASFM